MSLTTAPEAKTPQDVVVALLQQCQNAVMRLHHQAQQRLPPSGRELRGQLAQVEGKLSYCLQILRGDCTVSDTGGKPA